MRRVVVSVSFLVVAAVLLSRAVFAQEASPAAEEEMLELPPGVALAVVAQIAPVALPETAVLNVVRLTLEPGAEVPVHPHPGMEIAIVEEGSGAIRTAEGPAAQLIHGGVEGATPESYGPGEELLFTAGDIVIVPAGNMSDARSDEGGSALVLEFAPQMNDATPAA
jgi:quercetin dioxygenase-like cupin family protein